MTDIVHVRSPDGTTIACERFGSGPPLLLVHGTTSDRTRWLPVLDPLARRFTVHAMDRRGRGASGDAPAYAIEREFADVAAAAEAIGGSAGVVAHSFGAICALEAAQFCPAIATLVLYEPPVPTDKFPAAQNQADIDHIDALVAAGDREGALLTFYRNILRAPAAEIAKIRSGPDWPNRTALAHTVPRELRAARAYRFEPARFAAFKTRVLLVLGGDSPPRYQESTALLQRSLRGSDLAVIEGQQHNAISMAPDAFLRPVLDFIGG